MEPNDEPNTTPGDQTRPMRVRREQNGDQGEIRRVHAAAFGDPDHPDLDPVEARLVDVLRESDAWLPSMSLVALDTDRIVGHVLCTRAWVEETPVLALGPIGVMPSSQNGGVGHLLMNTAIGEADGLMEPLIGLVGSPGYYSRFGFVPASTLDIAPPVPEWDALFQVKTLDAYRNAITGRFEYADPFYSI